MGNERPNFTATFKEKFPANPPRTTRPRWVNTMYDLISIGERALTALMSIIKTEASEYVRNTLISAWSIGGFIIAIVLIMAAARELSTTMAKFTVVGLSGFLVLMHLMLGNMKNDD